MSSSPALHPIERTILLALAVNDSSGDSLATITGLSIDQVRRGIEWLKFKDLVLIDQSTVIRVELGPEGKAALAKGLPERRLVHGLMQGKTTIEEILASGAIKNDEVNAAIAGARRNQWIQLVEGKMNATE